MIEITTSGDFHNLEKFLSAMKRKDHMRVLDEYGKIGVDALAQATPVRSGQTAASWGYEIHSSSGSDTIYWINTNENKGFYIAIGLQYGHGTRNGGFVIGNDYINPAIRDVFDKLADEVWKGVTSA